MWKNSIIVFTNIAFNTVIQKHVGFNVRAYKTHFITGSCVTKASLETKCLRF